MARRVLVADDSPTIQRRAKDTLAAQGIDVVTVSNGVAAIKKLRDVNPLVVLADISMPGKDGYEVCDYVKNTPELRHVPVLLVVDDNEPYDQPRSVRVGADGRIKKPFNPDELVSMVTKFLTQAEAAAPPPPPPPSPAPQPEAVSEPVDEPPELFERRGVAVESIPEGVAFGEAVAEPPPDFPPVVAPAAGSTAGAEVAFAPAPEGLEQPPGLAEAAPPAPEPYGTGPAESFTAAEVPAQGAPPPEEPPAVAEPPQYAAPPEVADISAEPVLVEEVGEPESTAPAPSPAEGTMVFRSPTQIAEPVMSDEVTPEPEPAAVEAPPPPPFPEIAIPTTTLDAFSSTDTARGNVQYAPPAPAAPESAAPALDAQAVHSIVHRVVVKMSPPALSPEVIEQMSRKFADEIIAEMAADMPHTA